MGELDDPVVVDFPLRGEWAAANTPAHRIPSHGTDMLGQRYAFDFVRIDDRNGFHIHPAGTLRSYVVGGRTRECYGWGQTVHAPFDGEVVEAVDGVPERAWLHLVRELALVLKNAVTFDPAKRGLDPVLGNHVIMRTGETFCGAGGSSACDVVGMSVDVRVTRGSGTDAVLERTFCPLPPFVTGS